MWLLRRLDIARRGAELLDRKRQALLREQARARAEVDDARRAWHDAAAQAELWSGRASMSTAPGGWSYWPATSTGRHLFDSGGRI